MNDRILNRTKSGHRARGFFLVLLFFPLIPAGTTLAQSSGPATGTLLLAGGGVKDEAIFQEFIDLAGGTDARIVVVPTAGGAPDYTDSCPCAEGFRRLGVADVSVLHTYDPVVADTDDFVAPISGATVQGSYLARGDTKTNTIMMGDHESGFGFLSGVAVDQHVLRRNRHFDLLEIVDAHPDLLGIGIDEDTAIVVTQDRFEVIGQSYVLIYDAGTKLNSGAPFYFLAPGDIFCLAERRPVGEDVRGLQERLKAEDRE